MAFKMKGSPMKRNFGIGTDENPDTRGPVKPTVGPVTERRKFDHSERINDLQDRIEYLTNDIDELSGDQSRKATAKKKELIDKDDERGVEFGSSKKQGSGVTTRAQGTEALRIPLNTGASQAGSAGTGVNA